MQSIFFKEAQQNLDRLCQKACKDHEPCIVNREDNNHVVILSLADFNAWQDKRNTTHTIYGDWKTGAIETSTARLLVETH